MTGLIVPAGTGSHKVEVNGGLVIGLTTGTATANTVLQAEARIVDDLGATIAYGLGTFVVVTATSITPRLTVPLKGLQGPVAGQRTYKVQAQFTALSGTIGTASAAALFSVASRSMRASNR